MKFLGDFKSQQTVLVKFNTTTLDGTPITLAGTPAISVYKGSGTSKTTTGVTLTVGLDSTTGLHQVAIATTDAFYVKGEDYEVVITTGTVDGVSVVGKVIAKFSIENRAESKPLIPFTVVSDAGNSVSQFKTNLSASVDDTWKFPIFIMMDSGTAANIFAPKMSNNYIGATKIFVLAEDLPAVPQAGDTGYVMVR